MGGTSRREMRVSSHTRLDNGAALVEMALILPLLVMLLLGIVTAGIAYNHQLSLTHAAREAGRYGATLPVSNFGSMEPWLMAVEDRAFDEAIGTLDAGTPGLYVCVAYVHPNGSAATDTTARLENGAFSLGAECFSDGRPNDERRVQVRVGRDTDLNALLFQTTLNLDSEATNRFEAALGF